MSSNPRFFVEMLPKQGVVNLDADNALHAATVLRLKEGAAVELFDGRGGVGRGKLTQVSKRCAQVMLEASSMEQVDQIPLHLYVALPKGDRQRTLIDGLTQLGVAQLSPLLCERNVALPSPNVLERLRKAVIESCKQCQRNFLLHISDPIDVSELCAKSESLDALRLFAHPYGNSLKLGKIEIPAAGNVEMVIGPEGGLSESEAEQLRDSQWQQISLGPRILRVETAAIAVAAYFSMQD